MRAASDDELLVAAQRGDEHAFSAFYRRYERPVAAYLRGATRSAELAADLTAETFATVVVALDRFDPAKGSAGAWLFGIARNLLARSLERGRVIDRARRRLHLGAVVISDEALDEIDTLITEDWVGGVLATLPLDEADAIRARVIEDRVRTDCRGAAMFAERCAQARESRPGPTEDNVEGGPAMEPLMADLETALRARVRSRSARRRPAFGVLSLALGMAVALAVFLLALTVHTGGRAERGAVSPDQTGLSAPPGLWVGAARGVVPPTRLQPGQYWYVRSLVDQSQIELLRGPHRPSEIRVHQDVVIERWIGRGGQVSRWLQTPVEPLRFASPADRARWRAAGSPTSLGQRGAQVGYSFGSSGFGDIASLSYGEVQRLPTDPTRLLSVVTADLMAAPARRRLPAKFRAAFIARRLPRAVVALLGAPAPAAVHAALLAAARRLAGTRARPGPDPLGRPGLVLPLGRHDAAVIDPASGALLADTAFGGLGAYVGTGLVNSPSTLPRGVPPVAAWSSAPQSQRVLPAALVRSFQVFRHMRAHESTAVPNQAGLQIWLLPQAQQTCMETRDLRLGPAGGGGDCVPNRMVLAGEMSPITSASNGITVTGLAPNGNRTVTLRLADGSSRKVPVSHNVYVARSRVGFQTVTLKDSAGVLRTWRVPDGG